MASLIRITICQYQRAGWPFLERFGVSHYPSRHDRRCKDPPLSTPLVSRNPGLTASPHQPAPVFANCETNHTALPSFQAFQDSTLPYNREMLDDSDSILSNKKHYGPILHTEAGLHVMRCSFCNQIFRKPIKSANQNGQSQRASNVCIQSCDWSIDNNMVRCRSCSYIGPLP